MTIGDGITVPHVCKIYYYTLPNPTKTSPTDTKQVYDFNGSQFIKLIDYEEGGND